MPPGWPLKDDYKAKGPIAALSADWLNTVAHILNDLTGKGCQIQKTASGYGWQVVVDDGTGGGLGYRWQVVDQGSGTVWVNIGTWTRRGIDLTLVPEPGETYKELTGVGSDDYVYAVLSNSSGNKQDGLIPNEVTVAAGAAVPADTSENKYWVLGKFTSSLYKQHWLGGDMDDTLEMPDSNAVTVGDPGNNQRKTLGWNPDSSYYEDMLQLYDVENAEAQAKSILYFDADNSNGGDVVWAAIDAERATPTRQTIEVIDEGSGTGTLQIYAADDAANQAVPWLDKDGAPEVLTWGYICQIDSDPQVGTSDDVAGVISATFNDPADGDLYLSCPNFTVANGRLEIDKTTSVTVPIFGTGSTDASDFFVHWLEAVWPLLPNITHAQLSEREIDGSSHPSLYWLINGDKTRNVAGSADISELECGYIQNTGTNYIDVGGQLLTQGATGVLDWGNQQLLNTSGDPVLDWANYTMGDGSDTFITWADVSGDTSLTPTNDLILNPTNDIVYGTSAGLSGKWRMINPATGDSVEMEFYKGALIGAVTV
jgi:hypothetical protein